MLVACLFLAILLLPSGALAGQYTFTKVADDTGPLTTFWGPPAIGPGGTVFFPARHPVGGYGIYAGSGGPVTTIVDSSGLFAAVGWPSVNASGTLAFGGLLDTGVRGVFKTDGVTVTAVALFGPGEDYMIGNINEPGAVAFEAQFGGMGRGVYLGSGGALTAIAHSSGPIEFGMGWASPLVNAGGSVVFHAYLDSGSAGIFRGAGGPLTTIADASGPLDDFGAVPTINAAGAVAFIAGRDAGGRGIFIGDGSAVTTWVDGSGGFDSFFDSIINDHGVVGFSASTDGGEVGLFIGPDPVADAVIMTGAPLFGSTLVSVSFSFGGFNDAGQFAFNAELADGTRAIVRADPMVIPVPASATLLLVTSAVVGLGLFERMRRASR